MDSTALVAMLQESLPGIGVQSAPSLDAQMTLVAPPDQLVPVMQTLRDRRDLAFACLAELTAVDYHPREPRFELVYMLISLEHHLRLRVKVPLPANDPHAATVTGIWPSANWLEREVWDLFGIAFDGHPDPRRLLMPEDWEGYPLRKDYPVQIKMAARTTEPMQVTEDEFRANIQKDRLSRG